MDAGWEERKQVAWRGGLLAALLVLSGMVSAKECGDCHSGQDEKAQAVSVASNSAHSSLECNECHTGVKLIEGNTAKPHGDKVRPVQCKSCHEDQHKTFMGSSHSVKMKEYFEKQGNGKPAQSCVSCHATDAHSIAKAKDPVSPATRPNIAAACLKCHDKVQPIVVDKYTESIHGTSVAAGKLKAAVCSDCHGSHAIDHSRLPNSTVFRTTIPQTCGKCHPAEFSEYMASYHWQSVIKGFREAPVCTDCHGEHTIRSRRDPQSSTWAGNVTKTCTACHGSERMATKFMIMPGGVESLKETFHGISSTIGDIRVANCASCHSSHMILPRSDPRSFVNPANLGRTCGMCHPGAESRFINERIHTTAAAPSHWIVGVVRQIYIWLLALTIGGMLTHNLLDLRYKSMHGLPYHKHEMLHPRMNVNERVQHALLTITFLVLAVSGLARAYPHSPFAWPFQLFSPETDVRGLTHRVAAVAFVLLGVYHVYFLLLTRRGRAQVKELMPRPRDAFDAKDTALKYLGFRGKPMTLPHYGYVEKAEYWALVWGTIIMTVTGVMLWFVNVTLSIFPLWVSDLASTIHFWEAMLAVLAILVWHGYWVALDPEYYPLNLTWLIGHPRPASAPPPYLHENEQAESQAEKPTPTGDLAAGI